MSRKSRRLNRKLIYKQKVEKRLMAGVSIIAVIAIIFTTRLLLGKEAIRKIKLAEVCEEKKKIIYEMSPIRQDERLVAYENNYKSFVLEKKKQEEQQISKRKQVASGKKSKPKVSKKVASKKVVATRGRSEFKSYMGGWKVAAKNSPEKALIKKSSPDEYGFLKYDDCYLVALGTYYDKEIGSKFMVTMENGNQYKVIRADTKANAHTDSTNRYHRSDGSEIEFVIHQSFYSRNSEAARAGDASKTPNGLFEGKIRSITPIK